MRNKILLFFDSGYTAPSRQTICRRLKHLHIHHYQKLIHDLKQVDYISITTDFWTNRRMQCFLVITGHYFENNSYDLKSTILDFSTFKHQHTSYEISRILKKKLEELGILHKVVRVTADGARNMVKAIDSLDFNAKRFWCIAHRMHLTVTNALSFWVKKKIEDNGFGAEDEDESNVNHIIFFSFLSTTVEQ